MRAGAGRGGGGPPPPPPPPRLRRRPPPVVLSEDLVRAPEGTLRALCAELDLPFQPQMLRWEAGPKPYDGVWAPWWYGQTHKSTGKRPHCALCV